MSRRVLVVDDEPDILDLLTMLFEDDARCATVAGVGALDDVVPEAIKLQADSIVLDLMFGHRTCVEILPSLRRARPDAHIVVFTSSRRAAMAAGVRDTLQATYGVALTGVAGPDPQDGNPPGTVFVAVAGPGDGRVREVRAVGDRQAVRAAAVDAAIDLLRDLLDHPPEA